ncbi:MAG TPA: flagellar M-ring protein FliF C-terminal domain-containing protein [Candidatus Babeliales bacterium]|nr:flagellar M-ring protein FliF C-terminal domain-containing protein [Candidatus Babeliales bacterium]
MRAAEYLVARWNSLPRAMRFSAGAGFLACIAIAIAIFIAGHQSRVALFSAPLHPEQLTEVEESLAAWSVPFTPASENVLVDAGRRSDLLLRLSLAGIPHPHLSSTSEALQSIGVLTPQAVIEAQTRAGLAGDIEAGLRGVEGVDDARVIVAPAKPAEFADEAAHDASASVRLRLRSGMQLASEAVAGIRAFVAASVPELQPARVTILDDRGVALSDNAVTTDDAAGLQRSLESALDAAFGEGAALVRVRAEYDAAQSTERQFRRQPAAAEAIERIGRSESYDAAGKRYRHVEEAEDRGSETREIVSQNPSGALKRISAAVFVDQSRALDLAKVRELAEATLGYDARRGDALAIEAIDFHREPVVRKDFWWMLYGTLLALAPALILAIGLVACARFLVPPVAGLVQTLAQSAAVERAAKAADGFPPSRVRSMLEQEPPHAAAAIISALPAATATAVLELYPPHEREAIVHRMQRNNSSLIPNTQEILRRRA